MKRAVTLFLIVVLLLGAVPLLSVSAQGEAQSYLVIASTNRLSNSLTAKIEAAGGTVVRVMPEIGVAIVSSSDANFAANAASISGLQYVIDNVAAKTFLPESLPAPVLDYGNPPNSGDDDFFFDLQWGHDVVNAPEAWDAGVRGQGVRVAVLDGGFDLDHPDLAPNINLALSMDFTGEGLQYGLANTFSHGSHTAGTIAAADNGFGTIGVAPEAELVLVKVLGDAGSGSFGDIISGMYYAAGTADADVISMSLGLYISRSEGPQEIAGLYVAMNRVANYAFQQGALVVVSAGNDGADLDGDGDFVRFEGSMPHTVAVSATTTLNWATPPHDLTQYLASYSNYGTSGVNFAGPGGSVDYPGNEGCVVAGLARPCWVFDLVFSTGNNGWYWSAGTSMATPHVSGIAALIISENGGEMNPAHVLQILRARALDLGKPGHDDVYGAGLINSGY